MHHLPTWKTGAAVRTTRLNLRPDTDLPLLGQHPASAKTPANNRIASASRFIAEAPNQ
jgi:hypothetical protein